MDDPAYGLTFRRDGDGLRAEVVGERTFDNTVAYWQGIVERIKAQRPRWLSERRRAPDARAGLRAPGEAPPLAGR